jgi:hypothetical protein
VEFSRATSLSSLTIDDEPKISNDAMLKVCLFLSFFLCSFVRSFVCLSAFYLSLRLCVCTPVHTVVHSFIHYLESLFRNS